MAYPSAEAPTAVGVYGAVQFFPGTGELCREWHNVSGINNLENIAMANSRANSERTNETVMLSSIFIRIFAFLLLTATTAAVFAMPYMAG